jgi:hypothetical protein
LKNRSGRRLTILPLSLKRLFQGTLVVFQTAGIIVRSPLRDEPTFQSIGLISCHCVGAGRGTHSSSGASGVYGSGEVSSRSVRMSTVETPSTIA